MKINELNQYILNEDWGNLKRLDPYILNLIRTTRYGNTPNGIGQNSQLVLVNPKGTVFNTFLNWNDKYIGVVIRASSQQVLTIFGGRNFAILNTNLLKNIIDEYYDKNPEAFEIYQARYGTKYPPETLKNSLLGSVVSMFTIKGKDKTSEILSDTFENVVIKRLIEKVIEIIKGSGNTLTFWGITIDKNREELNKSRIKGMHNLNYGNLHYLNPHRYDPKKNPDFTREWNRIARDNLKSKLEKFKAERASKTNTPEEFFNLLQKSGYMQKVNIGGYVYELKAHDIRTSQILNVQHPESYPKANPGNFIEYVYSSSLSPDTPQKIEFKKQLEPYYEKWSKAPEKTRQEKEIRENLYAEYQAKRNELQELMPPNSFKITFKLQGASIVPDKLIASKNKIYI